MSLDPGIFQRRVPSWTSFRRSNSPALNSSPLLTLVSTRGSSLAWISCSRWVLSSSSTYKTRTKHEHLLECKEDWLLILKVFPKTFGCHFIDEMYDMILWHRDILCSSLTFSSWAKEVVPIPLGHTGGGGGTGAADWTCWPLPTSSLGCQVVIMVWKQVCSRLWGVWPQCRWFMCQCDPIFSRQQVPVSESPVMVQTIMITTCP